MAKHTLRRKGSSSLPLATRGGLVAVLLVGAASCVPAGAAYGPGGSAFAAARSGSVAPPAPSDAPPPPPPMVLQNVSPTDAAQINASIPIAAIDNPRAPSVIFRAADAVDQLRSEDCLAQAVYYEARSESEDGQRAVAQVVLNRVRHPAFPNSVCGVVYQGPQRAGGGCQFTFTCDGSLAVAPSGLAWAEARRIAAEALAGYVYAPVGEATHYHTQQVVPAWAFRLAKVAVIGAHSFYRLPGAWGEPGAFRQAYARHEQMPSVLMATRLPASVSRVAPTLPILADAFAPTPAAAATAASGPPAQPVVFDRLPVSQVKAAFRDSGRALSDAPPPSVPGSDETPIPASIPATRG